MAALWLVEPQGKADLNPDWCPSIGSAARCYILAEYCHDPEKEPKCTMPPFWPA
jgi:hypothetical protein